MADSIIQLTTADTTKLQAISQETFKDTFGGYNTDDDMDWYLNNELSTKQLRSQLANTNSFFYFSENDNQTVGYLKLNINDAQSNDQGGDALEIERLYVRPDYKRLGYGRQLMDFAIKRAYQLDKDVIWLGVWEYNHAAQRFYEAMGFTQFGDYLFTLGGAHQRDVLMRKELKVRV